MTDVALDIAALGAAYRAGLNPTDVVAEVAQRIAPRGDDAVWITLLAESQLMNEAARLAAIPDGPSRLPLYGLPFAVKDNIDVAGLPTTAGCPAFAYTPAETAPVVAALQAAGAMLIGKTNLDQFATGLVGTRSPYGIPRSVFSTDHIAGGSSSGSAVAVAAGLVSFALGTDTAGSGRVPAAFNNIVGLKPTRGVLSTRGVVPACRALDCVSIFALSAADAMTVMHVARHDDEADPYARRAMPHPLAIEAPRLGVLRDVDRQFFGDTEAAQLYDETIAAATAGGAIIEEIDYQPLAEAAALLYGPIVAERFAAVGAFIVDNPRAIDPVVRGIIEGGASVKGADVFAALHRIEGLKRELTGLWSRLDALLLPTTPTTYTVDAVKADPVALNSRLGTYTNFVNLLDCAAVAVPAGFRPNGLPFGVTLVGPAFSDADLAVIADRVHRAASCGTGVMRHALPPEAASHPAPGLVELAVVGAHLRGQPLNHELTARGAKFRRQTKTAPGYRLYALQGTVPPKPGLARSPAHAGDGIEVEIWCLTEQAFGSFTAAVPPPLGIGTVTLADGRTVKGFLAEPYALEGARDITSFGGWRAYLASGT